MTLTVLDAQRRGDRWLAELRIGGSGPDVVLEQLETGVRVSVPVGEEVVRVQLPASAPYSLIRCGDDIVALGARYVGLADLIRRGGRPRRGEVVGVWGGEHDVGELVLERAHLVVGPGTTLNLAGGIRCDGGTVRILGTPDAVVHVRGGPIALVDAAPTSRIAHACFADGQGASGGALSVVHVGRIELADVTFDACRADLGGAVYAEATELHAARIRARRNRATRGGAFALRHVHGVIEQVALDDNVAELEGGGLWCWATDLRLDGSIRRNEAPRGPAIWAPGSTVRGDVDAGPQPLGGVVGP